jgi:hypothetical protein
MSENIVEFCGHKFIKAPDIGWMYYKCLTCFYEEKFIIFKIATGVKILSCDDAIIKNIIE